MTPEPPPPRSPEMSEPHTHATVTREHEHVGYPRHEHRWLTLEDAIAAERAEPSRSSPDPLTGEPLTAEQVASMVRALDNGAANPYTEGEGNLIRAFAATLDALRAETPRSTPDRIVVGPRNRHGGLSRLGSSPDPDLSETLKRLESMTWQDTLTEQGVRFAVEYIRAAVASTPTATMSATASAANSVSTHGRTDSRLGSSPDLTGDPRA